MLCAFTGIDTKWNQTASQDATRKDTSSHNHPRSRRRPGFDSREHYFIASGTHQFTRTTAAGSVGLLDHDHLLLLWLMCVLRLCAWCILRWWWWCAWSWLRCDAFVCVIDIGMRMIHVSDLEHICLECRYGAYEHESWSIGVDIEQRNST